MRRWRPAHTYSPYFSPFKGMSYHEVKNKIHSLFWRAWADAEKAKEIATAQPTDLLCSMYWVFDILFGKSMDRNIPKNAIAHALRERNFTDADLLSIAHGVPILEWWKVLGLPPKPIKRVGVTGKEVVLE